MANAGLAISKLFRPGIEGRYSNDKHDTGGETYCGVARNKHPNWIGWGEVDRTKARKENMNADQLFNRLLPLLQSFYRAEFWAPIKGDQIKAQPMADFVFACAVNIGPVTAIKKLQRAVGVPVDGKIGEKTIAAINTKEALGRFAEEMRAFYEKIAVGNNARFKNGWMNRVAAYVTMDGNAVA
jgi:lysozyme family protein